MLKNTISAVTIAALVALSAPVSAGTVRATTAPSSDNDDLALGLVIIGLGILLFSNGFGSSAASSAKDDVKHGTVSPGLGNNSSAQENSYSRPKSRVLEKF